MNNWLKQNPVRTWKWHYWLAYYFLFFALCFTILFVQHLIFGYPKHTGAVAFGVATMAIIMALVDWASHRTGRKRR